MNRVVVGSGIAGLGAAWTLRDTADVLVLEAGPHIGGHADTVDVATGAGTVPVDMGFIVYNDLTYPHMIRLFGEIGVPVVESVDFGPSYARTLALWLDRFDAAWPAIADLGFDERFRRMWRYYLAYCEAGFNTGRISVQQWAFERGT